MMRGCAFALLTLFEMCVFTTVAVGQTEVSEDEPEHRELLELSRTGIDLNSAGLEDLCSVPGISPAVALAILKRREKLGCLRSFDDLLGAGGLTEPDLVGIRPYVNFGSECRGPGVRLAATAGWWVEAKAVGGGDASRAWAGDLRLDTGSTQCRLKRRPRGTSAFGGGALRAGRAKLAVGDLRGSLAPTIACELGRGILTLGGPLLKPPRGISNLTAFEVAPGAAVTTGSGERFRGVLLAAPGRVGVVSAAGAMIKPWGDEVGPAGLFSVCLASGRSHQVWGGYLVWAQPVSGATYVSVMWREKWYNGSAQTALRRAGGAWLVALSATPGPTRRFAVALAGRWGRYSNPIGPAVFRKPGTSMIASRVTFSLRLMYLGSVAFEHLQYAEGSGARYPKRLVRLRTRLRRGVWTECEMRCDGGGAAGGRTRLGLKGIWRPSSKAWVDVLFRIGGGDGSHSSLCGWRAMVARRFCDIEAGGFSFRTDRSLYFFEREIVGRPSIKALKGEGVGWYLHLRLEPSKGFSALSFMGKVEIKSRAVLRRNCPVCGTFFGVQFGRW